MAFSLSDARTTRMREPLQTPKKEHAKPAPVLPKAAEPAKAAKVDAAKPAPPPAVKEVCPCRDGLHVAEGTCRP